MIAVGKSPSRGRGVRRPRWYCVRLLLLLVVLVSSLTGCASDRYLRERRTPFNPLQSTLQVISRGGPRPSERTMQILRRYDLAEQHERNTEPVLVRLQQALAEEPTPDKCYAIAELAYIGGARSQQRGQQQQALDFYSTSVAHAYLYLFDGRFQEVRNHYDPMFRQACDLYNVALESSLRICQERGELLPGTTHSVQIGEQTFDVAVSLYGPWQNEEIERLDFVSRFELRRLNNRHHSYGLGVPLIAIRRPSEEDDPAGKYYPDSLSFAVTAFLRFYPTEDQGMACELELHDPLVSRFTQVGPSSVPLETDLTTPLAYFLDMPEIQKTSRFATQGLFFPDRTSNQGGLFMVEPFDPDKIPVLMVHGLWSSPLTWMEMFNDLRSFPEIRERYQFWFYLYPTGQPFWVSGLQLRRDLAELHQALDPEQQSSALRHMVLVGHSMGGLVSRLQVVESGDDFWRIITDQPLTEVVANDEDRRELEELLYFSPNPGVRRVVTIGTPHRGSRFANRTTRWLGRNLIWLPSMLVSTNERLIRQNPGVFHNTDFLMINTSIDSLSPRSPMLPTLLQAQRASWVREHNIIGVVPDEGFVGRIAAESDGVVQVEQARLDGAESEIMVTADHMSVHQHPRAILEIRRILLENLEDLRTSSELEWANGHAVGF